MSSPQKNSWSIGSAIHLQMHENLRWTDGRTDGLTPLDATVQIFMDIGVWGVRASRICGLHVPHATCTSAGCTMICPLIFLIARSMGPTWGPSGADRSQVGPMMATWTLQTGICLRCSPRSCTHKIFIRGACLPDPKMCHQGLQLRHSSIKFAVYFAC